mmetsp:Transcript_30012/g.72928  ORF Transcript_30012/g.72928 Transcript_30012/m.72928 type:complete len:527 (+) Transcript_30012:44-1624(+)
MSAPRSRVKSSQDPRGDPGGEALQGETAEVPNANRIKRWVKTIEFNVFVSGVILANAVTIGIQTEVMGADESFDPIFYSIECIFTVIFTAEIMIRLYTFGVGHFYIFRVERDRTITFQLMNFFDLVLALLALVDVFVLSHIKLAGVSFTVLRVVRILRVLRVLRLLHIIRELYIIITGLAQSARTLFWGGILLVMIFYICAIVLLPVVRGEDFANKPEVKTWFGSLTKAMYSCFVILTMEGWPQYADSLMEVKPWLWVFFVFFICFCSFAVLNLLLAVIVDNTMDVSRQFQEEHRLHKQLGLEPKYEQLRDILQQFADGDGSLTKQKFAEATTTVEARDILDLLKIDDNDMMDILDILLVGKATVIDVDEFVEYCKKVQGTATMRDILCLKSSVIAHGRSLFHRMARATESLTEMLESSVDDLNQLNELEAALNWDPARADVPDDVASLASSDESWLQESDGEGEDSTVATASTGPVADTSKHLRNLAVKTTSFADEDNLSSVLEGARSAREKYRDAMMRNRSPLA